MGCAIYIAVPRPMARIQQKLHGVKNTMTNKVQKIELKPALSSTVGTTLNVKEIRSTAVKLINAHTVEVNATQFYFEIFQSAIASHNTDQFITLRNEFLAVLGFSQVKELQNFEGLKSLYNRLSEWYKYCQKFEGSPATHNELRKEREAAAKAEKEAKKKIEEENASKINALSPRSQAILIKFQSMTPEEQDAWSAPLPLDVEV